MMAQRSWTLNAYGVKASSEMFRTFNGERFICWRSDATPEHIAAYRAAGVKCARRGCELFIREADSDKALAVDP
jgi:hypothetical protein